MIISPVGAEFFDADGQTNKTVAFPQFCEHALTF